jgi:hypothetical protein
MSLPGSLCLSNLETGFSFFDKLLEAFSVVFENAGDDEAITDKNSLSGELSIRKTEPCVKKSPPNMGGNPTTAFEKVPSFIDGEIGIHCGWHRKNPLSLSERTSLYRPAGYLGLALNPASHRLHFFSLLVLKAL